MTSMFFNDDLNVLNPCSISFSSGYSMSLEKGEDSKVFIVNATQCEFHGGKEFKLVFPLNQESLDIFQSMAYDAVEELRKLLE